MAITVARLARMMQGRYPTAKSLAQTAGFEDVRRYAFWEQGGKSRHLNAMELDAVAGLLDLTSSDIASDSGQPLFVQQAQVRFANETGGDVENEVA